MKTWKLTAACLAVVSFIGDNAWSRPVDLSAPSGELGAANSKGYLEIWREMDDAGINFGKGSYLPLRYKFSSDDSTGGILGPGFYMPMLEAKNVLIRESTMRAYLPCGKGLYFWKDSVDPTKFQTPDKEWTGALNSNGDFTAWRDDAWTIFYHQGRLTSIKTDEHHVFTWDYDGNTHMATGISEDGQSLVTVEPNQQGLLDAVVINGKRYELSYAERPLIEMVLGQPAVKELAIALSSFKYPDGKTETFHFELTPERVPTLTFTDRDQKQTVYTWDAATDHIASEEGPKGNWTYKVGEIAGPFALPALSRTNSEGKTEGMAVDNKMGIYTAQGKNGATTVTHVFETPGPLYHKVKSVEQISNGQTTTIYKASYDETGRLIRKIDQKGFTISYTYDENGKFLKTTVKPPTDPAILAALKQKEVTFLQQLARVSDPELRGDLLEQLAFLYIHDFGVPEKALALLPQITNRKQAFNVRMHAIDGDNNLTGQQKAEKFKVLLQEYPEEEHLLDILITARIRDDLVNAQMLNKS